jgi:hypothetical protein
MTHKDTHVGRIDLIVDLEKRCTKDVLVICLNVSYTINVHTLYNVDV